MVAPDWPYSGHISTPWAGRWGEEYLPPVLPLGGFRGRAASFLSWDSPT